MEISGVLVLAVKGALGSSEHQTAGVGMSKMLSLLASPWLEAKRFCWGCQASRFTHLHVACLGPRQGSRTSYKRLAVPWGLIPRDQSRRLKASYDFTNHTMLLYFHPHSVDTQGQTVFSVGKSEHQGCGLKRGCFTGGATTSVSSNH